MMNGNAKVLKLLALLATTVCVSAVVYEPDKAGLKDLPNRLPEAAPYVVAEAQVLPPPYHDHWEQEDSPGQCQTCHQKIFDEWNGSMMSNSWRDPAWRAAFLLLARSTSANGECDTPEGSEEHTSELQSLRHLVCRLLLEKKKQSRMR